MGLVNVYFIVERMSKRNGNIGVYQEQGMGLSLKHKGFKLVAI